MKKYSLVVIAILIILSQEQDPGYGVGTNAPFNRFSHPEDCCPFNTTWQFQHQEPLGYQNTVADYPNFNWGARCMCTHYIAVLDQSQSMAFPPGNWLIGTILANAIHAVWPDNPFQYGTLITFDDVAHLPNVLHQAPNQPDPVLYPFPAGPPGLGTSFNNAFLRVIDVLDQYHHENTCVFFISDGMAAPPAWFTIVYYIGHMFQIHRNGCYTCHYCIIIRHPFGLDVNYDRFYESCSRLHMHWVEVTEENYKQTMNNIIEKEKRATKSFIEDLNIQQFQISKDPNQKEQASFSNLRP